jgi:hypothetical protein
MLEHKNQPRTAVRMRLHRGLLAGRQSAEGGSKWCVPQQHPQQHPDSAKKTGLMLGINPGTWRR